MRVAFWRRVAFGLVLVPLLGIVAAAQPPAYDPAPGTFYPGSADKLKADTAALAAERKAAAEEASGERARLQSELTAVLKRINSLPYSPGPVVRPVTPTPPRPKSDPLDLSKSVDPLRLAMNLFRDNDFDAALRAFRVMDPTQLAREDRAFVRYMTGCCLRRLGRNPEASLIFTEVANSPDDEFVAGCAVWQLSLMRSGQELEAQLEQLRARAKPR